MQLKKIISLGISFIMIISSLNVVFAEDDFDSQTDEKIVFESEDNKLIDETSIENDINFQNEVISEIETEKSDEILDFNEKFEELTEISTSDSGSSELESTLENELKDSNTEEKTTEETTTEQETEKTTNENTEKIIPEFNLTPDEAMLKNPVMTPENQKKVLDYEARLMSEMQAEGWNLNNSGNDEIMLAATSDMSFNQYLAQYNYDYNSYEFMKNEIKLPYRSFVETKKNSAVFQSLLWSWRAATFELSDIASHSNKEAGFYEAILFDILYQGEDVNSISGTLNKKVKSSQASTLKSVAKFTEKESSAIFKQKLSEMSSDDLDKLSEAFNASSELQDVLKPIGGISKALSYADTVEKLIYKLCKTHVIMQRTDETAKILLDMRANTNNISMRMALDNMILICSDTVSEAGILYMLTVETGVEQLYNYVIDEMWGKVLEHFNLYGLAVSAGQAVGKTLSGWLFSTDADIEKYEELCALYEFEDVLKIIMRNYEENYKSSKSEYNSVLFNESYELLLNTYLLGIKASRDYVDIEYKGGKLSKLLMGLFGNTEVDYNEYMRLLKVFENGISESIKHMSTVAYDKYIIACEDGTAELVGMEKTNDNYSKENEEKVIIALNDCSFQTNDMNISKDMKLVGNVTTYTLTMNGGTLDLNGHTLTINGDLWQKDGNLKINGGKLIVNGSYIIASNITKNNDGTISYGATTALLSMRNYDDYVKITRDFVISGTFDSITGNYYDSTKLTAGIMEIGGNFTQLGGTSYISTFHTSGTHKVIFNGSNTQTIYFEGSNDPVFGSSFTNVEFLNPNIVLLNARIEGLVLDKDITLNSAELYIDGNLDLNGHMLTINGDFIQKNGKVIINGGKLNVNGDYIIASNIKENDDGIKSYGSTNATLEMTNLYDYVKIEGDFITNGGSTSTNNGNSILSSGVMEIGGDFTQFNGDSSYSFYTSGTHKVIFNGSSVQSIKFDNTSSKFTNVEFINSNIKFNSKIKGFKLNNDIILDSTELDIDGTFDLNGHSLTTKGDLFQKYGTLKINGGTLNVNGDYIIASGILENDDGTKTYYSTSAVLEMSNTEDYVKIKKDFITNGGSTSKGNNNSILKTGTMEIGGNFTQLNGNSSSFYTSGTHKVIFNGLDTQTISFGSTSSKFTNVEFLNSNIKFNSKIKGFKLNNNIILYSTELDIDGTLDLNDHTLTTVGNLIQKGGTLKINGGTLNISGDYVIASRILENDDGTKTYYSTSATLEMSNKNDSVKIVKDFITAGGSTSTGNNNSILKSGTMEIGGNFTQYNRGSSYAFYTSGTHKVILNGQDTQRICFDSTSSKFNNLSIVNKTGTIIFDSKTIVKSNLTQPGGAKIENSENVTLADKLAFEDHEELNATINKYVGNAENVIPTWMDYEAYINQTGPIVPITFSYGDVDGKEGITANDAACLLQKVLNMGIKLPIEEETNDYMKYADVSGDGKLTATDSAIILQKALHEDFVFPIEVKK